MNGTVWIKTEQEVMANPNWNGLVCKIILLFLLMMKNFMLAFFNNIRWLLFSLIAIPIGLLLALFVNQQIAGMRYIKSLFYFPFVINAVVIGVIFTWFYNPRYGALTFVLGYFGLDPIPVLADENLCNLWDNNSIFFSRNCLHNDSLYYWTNRC